MEEVHDSYITAGASIITANTYAANYTYMGSTDVHNTIDIVEKSNIEGKSDVTYTLRSLNNINFFIDRS